MKTEFAMNPFVQRMLASNGYNADGIRNAVKSARNDMSLLKEETKGGTLKLKPAKGDDGEAKVTATETTKATYEAKGNTPLAFGAWNDAVSAMAKVHGDPSGEMTPDAMPTLLRFWADAKFLTSAKPEGQAAPAGRVNTPKGNGKGNRVNTPEAAPVSAPSQG